MPFKKGESGNRKGRPPGSGRNQICRDWAENYGIAFMIRIAEGKENDLTVTGKKVKVRLSQRQEAAEYLIDQGIGRAPQRHEVSGGERPVRFVFGPGSDEPASE